MIAECYTDNRNSREGERQTDRQAHRETDIGRGM